jgi:hypothetical protein
LSLSEIIFKNQKVFKGAVNVKYFFWPAETSSEHLIVTFSGFNGNEANGEPAYYNYVKQLADVDCNRLFILDSYDKHPCYYLGKNDKLDYETTVTSIIHYVANQQNIPNTIITCGSSKGGTAALYFGMKYNYGHIIAGGMQVKVGSYLHGLSEYTKETVLKLITGGSSEADRDNLDKHFEDVFKNNKTTSNINLHIGKGDHHFESHLKPLLTILDDRNVKYNLEIKDYMEHTGLATHFPPFISDTINKIM